MPVQTRVIHYYVCLGAAGGKEWKVFMNNVVHFNMILEINQLLKENNIEYSIHGVGGCTCCGLELIQDGKSYPTDKILEIINGSLKITGFMFKKTKISQDFLQFIQNLIKNLDYKVTL